MLYCKQNWITNQKMIRTFFLFLLSCALTSSALAGPSVKTPDGIKLEVQTSSLNESQRLKYILVDLLLTNENDTKKISFDQKFEYILSDEFDNHYRILPKPGNYNDPVERKPSNFPSIYPKESYAHVLFFEAPVTKAEKLKLEIKSSIPGLEGPFKIDFSLQSPEPVAATGPAKVEIRFPENGDVFLTGDIMPLDINIHSGELPSKIIIVAFGSTLQDSKPAEENIYDIVIPAEAPTGQTSISVIAHWIKPRNSVQQILSKDVVIYVNPGQPASL